jgi:hypothetical protein
VEEQYITSALDAIYEACFVNFNAYAAKQEPQEQKFAGAQTGTFRSAQPGQAIGVANGVLPDGSPENPDSTHQLEVWTGINFGVAMFFAQMGQRQRALGNYGGGGAAGLSLWATVSDTGSDYGVGHVSGLPLFAAPRDLGGLCHGQDGKVLISITQPVKTSNPDLATTKHYALRGCLKRG